MRKGRGLREPGMDTSAKAVRFDDNSMWVELSDGRALGVPYAWFPRLLNATPAQREAVQIGRFGLHWEDIDEDISVAGLLAGRRDQTAALYSNQELSLFGNLSEVEHAPSNF